MRKPLTAGIIAVVLGTVFPLSVYAEGDWERGKESYRVCAACHGSEGEGNQKLSAPRLAGQHTWYVERQLRNWREGIRGIHPEDLYGMQMRPPAMTLMDDGALNGVVAFIGTLRGAVSKPTIQADTAAGKTGYVTCVACHGVKGEGNKALNAPKIAGLPDWYIVRQLRGFKKGVRGTHQKDVYGMQMRPMAMTLADDAAVNNVAAYVATFTEEAAAAVAETEVPESITEAGEETPALAAVATAPVSGSAKNGKDLYAVCVSCHGADGAGNTALNAPKISGQQEWYVSRQLGNFKSGVRGTHAEDVYGQQMRPMAMTLADEQAMADVAAFVKTLPGTASVPTIEGDAAAGKVAYAVCVSCHGANGEGNQALNAPQISGQQDWYIVRQLQNFKKGIRGTDGGDIYGRQMRPMALILADDAAVRNVAAYISALK